MQIAPTMERISDHRLVTNWPTSMSVVRYLTWNWREIDGTQEHPVAIAFRIAGEPDLVSQDEPISVTHEERAE